jgi:glutamine synthetase
MDYRPDPTKVKEVIALAAAKRIELIDLKFVDVPGNWRHITIPVSEFTEQLFSEGRGFDGSSVPGFQTIEESDMVMLPDPTTAFVEPYADVPTLSLIAEPMDPVSGTPVEYKNNPRYIARKAMAYLKSTGIADEMFVGPEVEFFIFDNVRYGDGEHFAAYQVDSIEGHWNSEGKDYHGEWNLGHRPGHQGGYFPAPPIDSQQNLRSAMVMAMQAAGIEVECHHHEVAGAGQAEIDIRYQSMLKQADQVMLYKYLVRNVAVAHGKSVTFMPKPIFGENGSGMHTHQSLWKDGKPLFYDEAGYAGLSQEALWYIGGLITHAPSFLAIAAPTTNSYKRLTPGYEAPVVLTYSKRNRSAACRIPMYSAKPAAKRVEFRSADPLANPYLAFSAMLLAGLDGIKNKIEPGDPHQVDLFEGDHAKDLKLVPGSLDQALTELENDQDYLTEGGVFEKDFLAAYVAEKRETEVDAVRLRPHPHEFTLYYNR